MIHVSISNREDLHVDYPEEMNTIDELYRLDFGITLFLSDTQAYMWQRMVNDCCV